MILHILGAGPAQLSAIRCAQSQGLQVAVSDANPQAPGMTLADYCSTASTFDSEAVLEDARRFGSDFLMTTGTDQPVLTAALVSEALGLPYFLTVPQARRVTNKKVMKQAFAREGIPSMNFAFLREDFSDADLGSLQFPLVIKPLDSQGQRGVLKVESLREIRDAFPSVLSFSREKEILAEEYYPSTELTVNAWAEKGRAVILLITDRVTIDNGSHLGVCISHRYPSLYQHRYDELSRLVQGITDTIGLNQGPLYFQILAGEKGFRVNEIACRLGGAYEDEFIPHMTGIPLMNMMIDLSIQKSFSPPDQKAVLSHLRGKHLSLQMFFYHPGTVDIQEGMNRVRTLDGIRGGRFLLPRGTLITERVNSTQRAGYFIVTGDSPEQINRRIMKAYDTIRVEDDRGRPLVDFNERMLFPL